MGRAEQDAVTNDPLVAVTMRLLGDRHEVVVERICSEVFEKRPVYAGLRDKAGFRRGVSKLVQLHCVTTVERRRLTPPEVVTLHVIGAQRAREGVPEDEMVGTVRAAMVAGWGQFVDLLAEVCPTSADMKTALKEVYGRNADFGDDVQAGLCSGFRSELEQRLPSHVRAQSAVVDRLVDGSWTDEELFAHAREHGVPLLPPLGPLLVTGPTDMATLRKAASEVAASVPSIVEGPTRTTGTVAHVVLVANQATVERRSKVLSDVREAASRLGAVVVVSPPSERPSSFGVAYGLAEAGLPFARSARPRGGLVLCDELALYRLLDSAGPEERTDFCGRVLGNLSSLPADKRAELVDTAEVLISVGWNATAACEVIGVHYQTMRYRVRRLREVTGRNPSDSVDRVLLELAVRIYRGWLVALSDDNG